MPVQICHTLHPAHLGFGPTRHWTVVQLSQLNNRLTHGAPIGNPPPLSHIFIPNNLKSAEIDPMYMDNFLVAEVTTGRMEGPFTVAQVHAIFGSHFCTAPLCLVEKLGSTALCLICHLSK